VVKFSIGAQNLGAHPAHRLSSPTRLSLDGLLSSRVRAPVYPERSGYRLPITQVNPFVRKWDMVPIVGFNPLFLPDINSVAHSMCRSFNCRPDQFEPVRTQDLAEKSTVLIGQVQAFVIQRDDPRNGFFEFG